MKGIMMKQDLKELIDKLEVNQVLTRDEFASLIANVSPDLSTYLFKKSKKAREKYYGKDVYIRGLIEFTNYCRNDCYYCGIRASNSNIARYRLTKEQILNCCETGYSLGFRTFVLQGGEDLSYKDEVFSDIIRSIKSKYPDCAITLSVGERPFESYKMYREAGADRYLLRHETANPNHYALLHPTKLSAENRKRCLYDLKKLGYQIGTGFMVGSPFQTPEFLAEDLLFIHELQPQMVGIGPFIPHHETPFAKEVGGTVELTLFMLGLIRLILPKVLMPATTAIGTIDPFGREKAICAGANVVMPNLSPLDVRESYMIYDHKICTGDEAAECLECMKLRIKGVGYQVVVARGDAAV